MEKEDNIGTRIHEYESNKVSVDKEFLKEMHDSIIYLVEHLGGKLPYVMHDAKMMEEERHEQEGYE